jgi:hypothetical protein
VPPLTAIENALVAALTAAVLKELGAEDRDREGDHGGDQERGATGGADTSPAAA